MQLEWFLIHIFVQSPSRERFRLQAPPQKIGGRGRRGGGGCWAMRTLHTQSPILVPWWICFTCRRLFVKSPLFLLGICTSLLRLYRYFNLFFFFKLKRYRVTNCSNCLFSPLHSRSFQKHVLLVWKGILSVEKRKELKAGSVWLDVVEWKYTKQKYWPDQRPHSRNSERLVIQRKQIYTDCTTRL